MCTEHAKSSITVHTTTVQLVSNRKITSSYDQTERGHQLLTNILVEMTGPLIKI